jgi:hypothetical protein
LKLSRFGRELIFNSKMATQPGKERRRRRTFASRLFPAPADQTHCRRNPGAAGDGKAPGEINGDAERSAVPSLAETGAGASAANDRGEPPPIDAPMEQWLAWAHQGETRSAEAPASAADTDEIREKQRAGRIYGIWANDSRITNDLRSRRPWTLAGMRGADSIVKALGLNPEENANAAREVFIWFCNRAVHRSLLPGERMPAVLDNPRRADPRKAYATALAQSAAERDRQSEGGDAALSQHAAEARQLVHSMEPSALRGYFMRFLEKTGISRRLWEQKDPRQSRHIMLEIRKLWQQDQRLASRKGRGR